MQLVTQNQKKFLAANVGEGNTATTKFGTIVTANKSATQADSVAADVATLVTNFNQLLAKLKAAGIML